MFYIEKPNPITSHGVQYSPIIAMYNTTALQKCKTFCIEFHAFVIFLGGRMGVFLYQTIKSHLYQSKRERKDQEFIQSSTTLDTGHHMGKRQKHKNHSI